MPSIKEYLSLFETVISCEFAITNEILYTVYSRSQDTLCLIRHHSRFNHSTVTIVPRKFEGLFQKWPVHSSSPVHIPYLLYLSWRRIQILLIAVWRKLCIFGLWGPTPLPLLRNDLEEGIYHSLIEGILLFTLVTLTATTLCIFGAVGVSFHISTCR